MQDNDVEEGTDELSEGVDFDVFYDEDPALTAAKNPTPSEESVDDLDETDEENQATG